MYLKVFAIETILTQPSGSNSFGYDAIFIPALLTVLLKCHLDHLKKIFGVIDVKQLMDKLTTFLKSNI